MITKIPGNYSNYQIKQLKELKPQVQYFNGVQQSADTVCFTGVQKKTPIYTAEFKEMYNETSKLFDKLEDNYSSYKTISQNGVKIGAQTTTFKPHIEYEMENGSGLTLSKSGIYSAGAIICDVMPPTHVSSKPIRYFINSTGTVERQVLKSGIPCGLLQNQEEAQALMEVLKKVSETITE